MTVKAYAKINLYLDVLKKRADGYHDIQTIIQTVNLYDLLTVHKLKKDKIQVICSDGDCPGGQKNLIWRAGRILKGYKSIAEGVVVRVKKNIPIGAGLGGGSADAVATFKALNLLWKLELSRDELISLSARIGCDLPPLMLGGTVYAEGKGERVTRLAGLPKFWVALVYPGISISTSKVYKLLSIKELTNSRKMINIAEQIGKVTRASELEKYLYNRLEEVVLKKYPGLEGIRNKLLQQGALGALVAGSGSTVFGILPDRRTGEKVKEFFKKYPYRVEIVQSI